MPANLAIPQLGHVKVIFIFRYYSPRTKEWWNQGTFNAIPFKRYQRSQIGKRKKKINDSRGGRPYIADRAGKWNHLSQMTGNMCRKPLK